MHLETEQLNTCRASWVHMPTTRARALATASLSLRPRLSTEATGLSTDTTGPSGGSTATCLALATMYFLSASSPRRSSTIAMAEVQSGHLARSASVRPSVGAEEPIGLGLVLRLGLKRNTVRRDAVALYGRVQGGVPTPYGVVAAV